jgi:hypothetical protein
MSGGAGPGGPGDGFEIGRPRYGSPPAQAPDAGAPAPGRRGHTERGIPDPRHLGPQGPRPVVVRTTAPAALVALAFAAVGWAIPVIGGVLAVRRGTRALAVIAASGGALDGAPLAVWARRLGWCYVVVWSGLLFYKFGGPAIQLVYSFVFK